VLISLVEIAPRREQKRPISIETLFAGFGYVRNHPILLGAISLDLFAVLLGGVTALLPIYARDIMQAGPWALGLLRSAPAVGALCATVILAHHAIAGRAGRVMFAAVGAFGVASVMFALSTSIALSFLALAIYGAADSVSVVIRQSLIQMRTPYDMLGRVAAVNSMFTGSFRLARRVSRRRDRGLARRGALGADRRRRRHRGHVDLDVGVPAAAQRRQARPRART